MADAAAGAAAAAGSPPSDRADRAIVLLGRVLISLGKQAPDEYDVAEMRDLFRAQFEAEDRLESERERIPANPVELAKAKEALAQAEVKALQQKLAIFTAAGMPEEEQKRVEVALLGAKIALAELLGSDATHLRAQLYCLLGIGRPPRPSPAVADNPPELCDETNVWTVDEKMQNFFNRPWALPEFHLDPMAVAEDSFVSAAADQIRLLLSGVQCSEERRRAIELTQEFLGADAARALVVLSPPFPFDAQVSSDPRIFLRPVVRFFWHFVMLYAVVLRKNVVAMGSPGVGKSSTLPVLVSLLLQAGNHVIFEHRDRGKVYFLTPVDGRIRVHSSPLKDLDWSACGLLRERNNPVVIVVEPGQVEPKLPPSAQVNAVTIMSCSPAKSYQGSWYKIFEGAQQLYYPRWNLGELVFVGTRLMKPPLSEESIRQRVDDFGPVARLVLSGTHEAWLAKLNEGLSGLKVEDLRKIVRRAAPPLDTSDKDGPSSFVLAVQPLDLAFFRYIQPLASARVALELGKAHGASLWADLRFEEGGNPAVPGHFFEGLALRALAEGGTFQCVARNEMVRLPASSTVAVTDNFLDAWSHQRSLPSQPPTWLLPRSLNEPVVDAAYVGPAVQLGGADVTSFGVQVAVAYKYGMSAAKPAKIARAMGAEPSTRSSAVSGATVPLVFVVPPWRQNFVLPDAPPGFGPLFVVIVDLSPRAASPRVP